MFTGVSCSNCPIHEFLVLYLICHKQVRDGTLYNDDALVRQPQLNPQNCHCTYCHQSLCQACALRWLSAYPQGGQGLFFWILLILLATQTSISVSQHLKEDLIHLSIPLLNSLKGDRTLYSEAYKNLHRYCSITFLICGKKRLAQVNRLVAGWQLFQHL